MANEIKESAAVNIPRSHQSAPKDTEEHKLFQIAAEEIRTGKFIPEEPENEGYNIAFQRGQLKEDPRELDFNETEYLALLAQHPAVQAAMRKMEREMVETSNTQEYLEKSQMLFEMNAMASSANQWDGQNRWVGKNNEEARHGLLLTPFQFMERLEKVIGERRVFMCPYTVLGRTPLMAIDLERKPEIILPGQDPEPEWKKGKKHVGTLQYPLGTEWMIMKFDEYGVPTCPKFLGWRTALVSMIKERTITEAEAHKAFPLYPSIASSWYQEQLAMFRNGKGRVQ